MTMVQNVGSLSVLRALLKKETNLLEWKLFMELETHLERRRESNVWQYYDNTVKVNNDDEIIIIKQFKLIIISEIHLQIYTWIMYDANIKFLFIFKISLFSRWDSLRTDKTRI